MQMTVGLKPKIFHFIPSSFCFWKFTNNRGEINICCDLFFDGEDGPVADLGSIARWEQGGFLEGAYVAFDCWDIGEF